MPRYADFLKPIEMDGFAQLSELRIAGDERGAERISSGPTFLTQLAEG